MTAAPPDHASAARRHAALDPARAEIQQQLGMVLVTAGGIASALPPLRRTVWLSPAGVDPLVNLGIACIEAGRFREAASSLRRALAAVPDDPDTHHGLGVAAAGEGRADEAVIRLRRAIRLRPTYAESAVRLANALLAAKRAAEAAAVGRRALALLPGRMPAHLDLGVALSTLEQHQRAVVYALRACAIEPDAAQPAINASAALLVLGRVADALGQLRRAAYRDGAGPEPFRNLLAAMTYDPAIDEEARWAAAREFARRHAPPRPRPAFRNPSVRGRRLTVGYLSSDLYDHPVARNLAPIVEAHDRSALRVVCFSDAAVEDAMTRRLRTATHGWRQTAGLSDAEVARCIRADEVDILVLLAGRFDRNRPLVANHRAAPIQMSLFDGGTSGLEEMDYLIADRVLVAPRGLRQERYIERVLRLPSLYVHTPVAGAPKPTAPPCRSTGCITFGCFNSPMKLSDDALGLWKRVLQELPEARLRLKYQSRYRDGDIPRRILDRLAIEPRRVDFLSGDDPVITHLRTYESIDIGLDAFPFSGSTTTWEALWMGVPVVTLIGDALVGRLGAAFLAPARLGELIATSPDDYVRIAVGLARDPARLAALRAGLRERIARSPLCDGAARARQFERLFRAVWRKRCRAEAAP